jgi:hypothetical protein
VAQEELPLTNEPKGTKWASSMGEGWSDDDASGDRPDDDASGDRPGDRPDDRPGDKPDDALT